MMEFSLTSLLLLVLVSSSPVGLLGAPTDEIYKDSKLEDPGLSSSVLIQSVDTGLYLRLEKFMFTDAIGLYTFNESDPAGFKFHVVNLQETDDDPLVELISLVSQLSGHCLTATYPNGGIVDQEYCRNVSKPRDNQKWKYNEQTGKLMNKGMDYSCLTASSSNQEQASVETRPCNNNNQRFKIVRLNLSQRESN